jgi:hypothetical protein
MKASVILYLLLVSTLSILPMDLLATTDNEKKDTHPKEASLQQVVDGCVEKKDWCGALDCCCKEITHIESMQASRRSRVSPFDQFIARTQADRAIKPRVDSLIDGLIAISKGLFLDNKPLLAAHAVQIRLRLKAHCCIPPSIARSHQNASARDRYLQALKLNPSFKFPVQAALKRFTSCQQELIQQSKTYSLGKAIAQQQTLAGLVEPLLGLLPIQQDNLRRDLIIAHTNQLIALLNRARILNQPAQTKKLLKQLKEDVRHCADFLDDCTYTDLFVHVHKHAAILEFKEDFPLFTLHGCQEPDEEQDPSDQE